MQNEIEEAKKYIIESAKAELLDIPIIKQLLEIDGVVLAGGAVRDQIGLVKAKDYDFFLTKIGAEQEARKLLGKTIAFTNYTATYNVDGLEIQLVFKQIYNNPQEIIDQFDFRVCQFAVDKNGVYYNSDAFDDLSNKILVCNNVTKPIDSLNRLVKYVKKGFDAREAYVDIVKKLAETNIQNVNTFYETTSLSMNMDIVDLTETTVGDISEQGCPF